MALTPAQIQAQKNALAKKAEATKLPEDTVVVPTGRRFFAKMAHSRFVFSDGQEVSFPMPYGTVISNPMYIQELDAICPPKGNNPNIYKETDVPEPLPLPKQNAVSEADLVVAESQIQSRGNVVTSQQIGPTNNAGLPTNVEESTLDPDLMNAAGNAAFFKAPNFAVPVSAEQAATLGASNSTS